MMTINNQQYAAITNMLVSYILPNRCKSHKINFVVECALAPVSAILNENVLLWFSKQCVFSRVQMENTVLISL